MSTEDGAREQSVEDIVAQLGIGDMDAQPMDPSELVAKLEAMSDGTELPIQDDKGVGDTSQRASSSSQTDAGKDEQQQNDGKQPDEGATTEPVGVLLKDGKHFIPYEKHKELRAKAETAEARAASAEARVKELEAQAQGGTGKTDEGDDGAKRSESTTTVNDDLALVADLEAQAEAYEAEGLTELAKTQRATAKALKAMAARVQSIGGYVETARSREAEIAKEAATQAKSAVEDAVDNNPKLRFLRDTDNPMWDLVADNDAVLRANPAFAKLPLEERLAKAVAMAEVAQGEIKLPPEYQSVADIKRDAARKASGAGSFRPSTLSDMPGGGLPRDTADEIANMDVSQLQRLMETASPDKLNELLANAG